MYSQLPKLKVRAFGNDLLRLHCHGKEGDEWQRLLAQIREALLVDTKGLGPNDHIFRGQQGLMSNNGIYRMVKGFLTRGGVYLDSVNPRERIQRCSLLSNHIDETKGAFVIFENLARLSPPSRGSVDDPLDREIFMTLTEAKILIEQWRREYNKVRPHSAIGYRPTVPEAIMPVSLT